MKGIVATCCAALFTSAGQAAAEQLQESSEQQQLQEHPRVNDWLEANWFDDLVKIPLTIDQGTNWYANLIIGESDAENTAGKCMFDNNSSRIVVYPGYTTSGSQDDWYTAPANVCDTTKTRELQTDGITITGYECRDRICIGSAYSNDEYDLESDPHTTVCNESQAFLDSTYVPSKDWTYYYNKYGATNSVCGLGKEAATIRSESFVSLAAQRKDITENLYSFEIYPHLQYLSSANTFRNMKEMSEGREPGTQKNHALQPHHLGKLPYKFDLELVSYLTLGGYDKNDMTTDIVWYDTAEGGDTWNITGVGMWIGDTNINPSGDVTVGPLVNFQIGNPYLGLAANSWSIYKTLIFETLNPDLSSKVYCNTWQNNEFCYWYNTACSAVNMPDNFVIQLGEYNYTIPMKYFLADTMNNNRHDCDVFIQELDQDATTATNTVRLGDPFFSGFMPIFDTANQSLGLAVSARAQEGVTQTQAVTPETMTLTKAPTLVQQLIQE